MKNLVFSERVMNVFANMETDYEAMNNLMQDVALGREIYDAETERMISKAEANEMIHNFSLQVLGISNPKDAKQVRRALRDNGREWFDIIEDTVDVTISTGLAESDWFNELVESKTIGYHDRQDFFIEEDGVLSVAKAGTSHHDHILQRLVAGQTISIPTELYVVKVGADINKYITGQVDWNKLVDAISTAYINTIQEQVYAQVSVAVGKLPSAFVGSGTPSASTKAAFDQIIEYVSAANNGADVVIMGTKSALSKVAAFGDVDWAASAMKDNVMNTGNIGIYEGTRLITIPNRFKDKNLSKLMFDTNKLMILPVIGEEGKFIKFVDEGDTEILEKMDRGDYVSDLQTYEVQRRFGVGVVLARKFGQWTIA